MNDPKVWITKRKTKRGSTYLLRWVCPQERKWKARAVGGDHKRAAREAAKLEEQLRIGTYKPDVRTTWQAFTDQVVGFLSGSHATEARRVLNEYAAQFDPKAPKDVTHATIREYVLYVREKGNAVSTVNKKLRYLRLCLREAVALHYVAVTPMDGWKWQKEPSRELRILDRDEERGLLEAANTMYGFQMATFVRFVLTTWARFAEATRMKWDDVNFDDESVYFRNTKSHEDRFIPIDPLGGLLADLRKLQAKTLQEGGPFVAYRDKANFDKKWQRVLKRAGIEQLTRHDLRRTGITRALLANMPLVTVQKLAGHKDIKTTMNYYTEVSKADLRQAVKRLAEAGS